MNDSANYKDHFELPIITPRLMTLVITEIMERMSGEKKWCGEETLKQIILNKYTILQLERQKEKEI